MAGGFAEPFAFCDPLKKGSSGSDQINQTTANPRSQESKFLVSGVSACDSEESSAADGFIGGGIVLDQAWMYDGFVWINLPKMSTKRDRPACSLVQLEDGGVSSTNTQFICS
jgi:hypothetical protein